MIDYVRLSTDIAIRKNVLARDMWTEEMTSDGQPYYYHSCRGVWLRYCTYETAKKPAGKSEAAKNALYAAATHHDITQSKYAHGIRVIKKSGIYPFCFLRKVGGVERLDNPLKLIRNTIEKTGSLVD